MKDLFTSEQVNVQQALDIVRLILGDNKIRLYYQEVFKLCSDIQGCAKIAMAHEGMPPDFWHKIAVYDRQTIDTPLNRTYRRSRYHSNVYKPITVDVEGSLVVLYIDDLVAKFHFKHAAQLCVWLRRAAKQAKNWAGDRSKILTTFARLTTAEENEQVRHAG